MPEETVVRIAVIALLIVGKKRTKQRKLTTKEIILSNTKAVASIIISKTRLFQTMGTYNSKRIVSVNFLLSNLSLLNVCTGTAGQPVKRIKTTPVHNCSSI